MRKISSELQAKSDRTGQKIRKYLPRPLKIFLKKTLDASLLKNFRSDMVFQGMTTHEGLLKVNET